MKDNECLGYQGVVKLGYILGFACSMPGKSSKHILPTGGLIVIYHGRK